MIWKLVGYDEDGNEQAALSLHAELALEGTSIIVCPIEHSITHADAIRLRLMLADAGILKVVVCNFPLQVWKVAPEEAQK